MIPRRIMVIAGEPSGDQLGAELVAALKAHRAIRSLTFPAKFFGAGGPKMAEQGVQLAFDLTEHAVVGADALRHPFKFLGFLKRLFREAQQLQPDVIVLVDNSGFNLRLAKMLKDFERHSRHTFNNWYPKIVYYVSPQVWASRASRVKQMEQDIDLILSVFPFEEAWYARHAPGLPVEFVGHPILDRYAGFTHKKKPQDRASTTPHVLLFPGSRHEELRRHLPIMTAAVDQIQQQQPISAQLVVPSAPLAEAARKLVEGRGIPVRIGGHAEEMPAADLAISKSGTITLECAYFSLPAVVLYRTSWITYLIAKQLTHVSYLAMPNVLANKPIFPEFIQNEATPQNVGSAALKLLQNQEHRQEVQQELRKVIDSLGSPGASRRAADAIIRYLKGQSVASYKGSLWSAPEPIASTE